MNIKNHRASWRLLQLLEFGIISDEGRKRQAKKVKRERDERRRNESKEPILNNGRLIMSRKNSVMGEI